MAGKRRKAKKKRKQRRKNLVQRFLQATGACFGRRESKTPLPRDCKGGGEGPQVQAVEQTECQEQTTLLCVTQNAFGSRKLCKQTTCGPGKTPKTPVVINNPVVEDANIKRFMKTIFQECKHMSWLIPYISNRDECAEKEPENNIPNLTEDIQVDKSAVSNYVAGIIQFAQLKFAACEAGDLEARSISATELQTICAMFLENITDDAAKQAENDFYADSIETQVKFGEEATESISQLMPNPCIKTIPQPKADSATEKETTQTSTEVEEDPRKGIESLERSVNMQVQTTTIHTDVSEDTSTGEKKQHEMRHYKEMDSKIQEQEIGGLGQEEEDNAAESERLWNVMTTFDVQYTCLMDDFSVNLLELHALVTGGTFGKSYKAKYAEASIEVTLYSEGYPTIDPGRLLSLRSKFVSRVLVYLQDENETDCIIYPDNYLGSLDALMEADPDRFYLGEDQAIFILSGLLEGIKHMISRRIVHGHLTPDIVKLNQKGYPVICDFSHAYNYRHGKLVPPRAEDFHVGYMSPEIASEIQIVPESDVFAAGSIAYEIIDGLPPFTGEDNEQTIKNVLDTDFRVEFDPDIFSKKAATIIGICLRHNIQARAEWEEMYDFLLEPDIDTDQEKESAMLPVIKKLLNT